LNGSSRVSTNTSSYGGGIYNDRGGVTLNDTSSVARNTATLRGGGVFNNLGTVQPRDSSSIRRNDPDNCVNC
jgi:hypothetical protein